MFDITEERLKEIEVTDLGLSTLKALRSRGAVDGNTALLSKEVASEMFMLPRSTTGALNALANKELVLKTPDTPRKYIITPLGIAFLEKKIS